MPMGGDLANRVRTARSERRELVLWRRCRAEHLGGAGLVEAHGSARVRHVIPECLEQAQRAHRDDIGCVLRDVEGDSDVALSAEMVDLIRRNGLEYAAQ